MRRIMVVALLCAFLAGCGLESQPIPQGAPVAKITGTDYIALGDCKQGRGKISFKGSEGKTIKWDVIPPEEKENFFQLAGGDLLYMPVQYGHTTIILGACTSNDLDMAYHTIIVSAGPRPDPDDPVDPDPNPGPGPQPTPASDLAKLAQKLAKEHIKDGRVEQGKALGAAILNVCNNYQSYDTEQAFREQIRLACHEALDMKVFDWEPVSAGVANAIWNQVQQGKIVGVKGLADAYKQVANGLQTLQ